MYYRVRKPARGFSLVELCITMVVLGILALSFFPSDSFRSFNLGAAAQIVEQDIRYARELANVTNINHGVSFVAAASYTVYRGTTATPATNPVTGNQLITNLGDQFDNVSIANTVQFEFNPLGRPVIGGGSTVQVTNGTSSITIMVNNETGTVSN